MPARRAKSGSNGKMQNLAFNPMQPEFYGEIGVRPVGLALFVRNDIVPFTFRFGEA